MTVLTLLLKTFLLSLPSSLFLLLSFSPSFSLHLSERRWMKKREKEEGEPDISLSLSGSECFEWKERKIFEFWWRTSWMMNCHLSFSLSLALSLSLNFSPSFSLFLFLTFSPSLFLSLSLSIVGGVEEKREEFSSDKKMKWSKKEKMEWKKSRREEAPKC